VEADGITLAIKLKVTVLTDASEKGLENAVNRHVASAAALATDKEVKTATINHQVDVQTAIVVSLVTEAGEATPVQKAESTAQVLTKQPCSNAARGPVTLAVALEAPAATEADAETKVPLAW